MDDDIFLSNMLQVSKEILILSQFEINTENSGIIQYLQYVESHPIFQYVEKILAETYLDMLGRGDGKEYTVNIFLHLQAAILRKRNMSSMKVALIGYTSAETDYIYEVLNFYFRNRVSINLLSDSMLEQIHQYDFDLLVATKHVDVDYLEHTPIIKISSIPTNSEILEIEKRVECHYSAVLGLDQEMMYAFSNPMNLGKT